MHSRQIQIDSAASLGKVVRASRKVKKIRQDAAASRIGVSENFLGKIERGGESVQWGKVFRVLKGLGVAVVLEVPASVTEFLNQPSTANGKRKRAKAVSAVVTHPSFTEIILSRDLSR